eukprot:355094-Chlamydomonas_euryale.AAC.6
METPPRGALLAGQGHLQCRGWSPASRRARRRSAAAHPGACSSWELPAEATSRTGRRPRRHSRPACQPLQPPCRGAMRRSNGGPRRGCRRLPRSVAAAAAVPCGRVLHSGTP